MTGVACWPQMSAAPHRFMYARLVCVTACRDRRRTPGVQKPDARCRRSREERFSGCEIRHASRSSCRARGVTRANKRCLLEAALARVGLAVAQLRGAPRETNCVRTDVETAVLDSVHAALAHQPKVVRTAATELEHAGWPCAAVADPTL